MRIERVITGDIGENCYLLEGIIVIDPGEDAISLLQQLETFDPVKIEAVLLTHSHYDHLLGINALVEDTKAPVYVGEEEVDFVKNGKMNPPTHFDNGFIKGINDVRGVKDGDILEFGDLKIKVMATPGHTDGGCCYLIEDSLFVGDTLFAEGRGRTDLHTGNEQVLHDSFEKIFALPEGIIAYPGHGPEFRLHEHALAP